MKKPITPFFVWWSVIAALLAATALPAANRAWRGKTGDFTHLWHAAQAMLNGENIYAAGEGRYIYPPLLAFLFQPLALIPERAAAIVWIALSSSLLLAAILIAAKEVVARWKIDNAPSTFLSIAAVALILNIDKVRSLLNLGQSDGLMLLAFACVLSWMERKPILAGLAVGFSANIKYLSLIFVPYFLLKRNYRAAITAMLSFAVFMLLPAVEVGFARGVEYMSAAIGGLAKMMGLAPAGADIFDVTWNRSVSITSTIFRLFRSYGWPDLAAALAITFVFIGVLTTIIWISRAHGVAIFGRAQSKAVTTLEWDVLIVLALVFSPQTTARHMVLMLLVYVVAIAVLFAQNENRSRAIIIAGIILMVTALTLPFGTSTSRAVWTWREIGGASWCALLFLLTLVWAGSRTISVKVDVDLSGGRAGAL